MKKCISGAISKNFVGSELELKSDLIHNGSEALTQGNKKQSVFGYNANLMKII